MKQYRFNNISKVITQIWTENERGRGKRKCDKTEIGIKNCRNARKVIKSAIKPSGQVADGSSDGGRLARKGTSRWRILLSVLVELKAI